jgi:hypothetical protein
MLLSCEYHLGQEKVNIMLRKPKYQQSQVLKPQRNCKNCRNKCHTLPETRAGLYLMVHSISELKILGASTYNGF